MNLDPSLPTETQSQMRRETVRLERVEPEKSGGLRKETDGALLWYDTRGKELSEDAMLSRIVHTAYTGIVLYASQLSGDLKGYALRQDKIVHVNNEAELELALSWGTEIGAPFTLSSSSLALLEQAKKKAIPTCYRAHVDDADSLRESIASGCRHDYLMVSFRDPTNIPLELVIASLQATNTVLIKEITDPSDSEDALVTLGVMEVGADGVLFSPASHDVLDELLGKLEEKKAGTLSIQTGTIVRSVPVGMGYRSCLDLATLFSPSEGMLIGSTSQGGILCCPEVFFLPYMELRPFRVNAGAVHSYVYNFEDRTDYMTELRAGSAVMIADIHGKLRRAIVGRVKTEVRPLRLIEVEFESRERINVLMQDDWHVRIFSSEGKPLNVTELKRGDKVLGHCAKPGRHVGIRVDEHIVEN